jgi:hypothetical protein
MKENEEEEGKIIQKGIFLFFFCVVCVVNGIASFSPAHCVYLYFHMHKQCERAREEMEGRQ